MSKDIKLKLEELRVQSFVTNLNFAEKNKLKGGMPKADPNSALPNSCNLSNNDACDEISAGPVCGSSMDNTCNCG